MPVTKPLLFLLLVAIVLNLVASAEISSVRPGQVLSHLHTVLLLGSLHLSSRLCDPPSEPRAFWLADQLLEIPNKRQLFCQHLRKTAE
jgi:hypothetical protein